jgi:hypothetical protein
MTVNRLNHFSTRSWTDAGRQLLLNIVIEATMSDFDFIVVGAGFASLANGRPTTCFKRSTPDQRPRKASQSPPIVAGLRTESRRSTVEAPFLKSAEAAETVHPPAAGRRVADEPLPTGREGAAPPGRCRVLLCATSSAR